MPFPANLTNAVDGVTDVVADHLNNLEAKVGIDNSHVATSLDYLVKNPASIDPGHGHPPAKVLPDMTGNSGKFLTTNGTTASWGDPAAGSPPTGTGFRHITAGAEDAAAKLVENADVAANAAIVESKLALNNPTHANTNDPNAGEKAALAGTNGTPGPSNKYVTHSDPRNSDARTPTAHGSAAHTGTIGAKDQVGLGNVDNTSDLNKPISTAVQTALDGKAASAHDHDMVYEPADAGIQTHIVTVSGNPHNVTKSEVGLGNVPNVDTTNPANITQDASHRFATDTEKTTWNGKIANVVDDTTPQLGGDLEYNGKNLVHAIPGSNLQANGDIIAGTVDTNAEGVGAPLFIAADSHFDTADASASTTAPCVALALETGTGAKQVLLRGVIRNDAWNWTVGPGAAGLIYLSATTGTMTQTQPSGTDEVIQILGWALSADVMYFNPQYNFITHN